MTALASIPVQTLRVADIDPSPLNPRHRNASAFSEEKLRALGESLASPTGQLEAILVRPSPTTPGRWELANGERRWRAAQLVGVDTLAAKVRDLSDADLVEIALAIGAGDNVESLTQLEEAVGYQRLMKLRGFDQRQLAVHLGRAADHVNRVLALLQLPPVAKEKLQTGELAARTAWLIARIPGEAPRAKAANAILESEIHGGVMPTRAAEDYILANICRTLKGAPFDTKSADLLPAAGPCTTCRFRAGNNREEYGDVGDPLKCMSPECFEQKLKAHRERVVEKVAVDGRVPLPPEENDRVFPPDERGLHYTSDYVAYNERPTPDVLKKEVNPSQAPTWRELVESGEATVQVYVGVHQEGHAVELVKRAEAIAAADVNERRIFAESEVKRAAQRAERGDSIAAADAAARHEAREREAEARSRAAQEKAEAEARKKAERAQKKKDKASRELLSALFDKLREEDDRQHPIWRSYATQSLLFEALRETLSAEEIALVVGACDAEASEDERTRDGLNDLSSRLALDHLAALNVVLAIAPRWRAQGAEGELPKLWAKEILAGTGDLAGVEGPVGGAEPITREKLVQPAPADWPVSPGQVILSEEQIEEATDFSPSQCDEWNDRLREVFLAYDHDAAVPCVRSKAEAADVLDSIIANTPAAELERMAEWLSTGPRWQIPGVEWMASEIRASLAAGREPSGEAAPAAKQSLDDMLNTALPGSTTAARAKIAAKYIKRVCGAEKPESELTPAELAKIGAILAEAKGARKAAAAKVTTASEQEAA